MTPKSLIQRFIVFSLLLTIITACSSADSETPSPTQTPIPATPTQTATFTPSPTDTPTATPTPTEIPSYLSQLAPWKEGMGDSRDNFPMVDMAHASDWIREAVGKMVVNADGSSTYDGKPLFAADAPKARVVPYGNEGQYKISSGYAGWYLPIAGYQADYEHGAIIDGITEFHWLVAINTDHGPVIADVIYRLGSNEYPGLSFDRKITENGQKFVIMLSDPGGDFANKIRNPTLMRNGNFSGASGSFTLNPEFISLAESMKQFIFPQVYFPTGMYFKSD